MKVLKEVKCKNWDDFKKKIGNLSEKGDYVFRGQNDADWKLETSLQRFLKKRTGIISPIALAGPDPIEEILKKYIKLINTVEKGNVYTEKSDFWGIGQHYGLPTPFLDWTKTVNKAAFFAFSDEILYTNSHSNVAIYALRVKNIHTLADNGNLQNLIKSNGGIKIFEREGFSIVAPNEKLPNYRIDSQDGLFTEIETLNNISFDLVEFFETKIYDVYRLKKPILMKFIIPRSEFKAALIDLHASSRIDFFNIYPDKEGCAKQVLFECVLNL